MDMNSGRIFQLTEAELDLRQKAGEQIERLEDEEAALLRNMNRHERRAALARMRGRGAVSAGVIR